LFRLRESGLAGKDELELGWRKLVAKLNIPRPAAWSLNARR
jgi:hypothetical protein